jgi:hypothetical protein
VLVSAAVGVAVALAGSLEYRGEARFLVDVAPGDQDRLAPYRAELINHTWANMPTPDGPATFRWDVSAEVEATVLQLILNTEDRQAGRQSLKNMAQRYLTHLSEVAERILTQPSEAEVVLQRRLQDLRSGLAEAARRQEAYEKSQPQGDASLDRNKVGERLRAHRGQFLDNHGQLRAAQELLAELKANPVPERPTIHPELIERALKADVPLQQDLAELQLRRAEIRLQLLNVWQSATPALEELVTAASELQRHLGAEEGDRARGAHRAALERAIEAVDEYRGRLRRFSREWTTTFVDLSRDSDDQPASPQILELQEAIAKLLADFLYEASSSLTVMRDQVRRLGAESDAQARHHVLTARLTRGFHSLQTAHHQFEFSASEVRPSDNFRLASAVRAVRGLRRRTQLRREEITQHLEQVVRYQREQTRESDIRNLGERTGQLSAAADASLEVMLESLDEFDTATAQAEDYAAAKAAWEAWAERVSELEADISNMQAALEKRAAQRRSPVRPEAVRLISCKMGVLPSNLPQRLAYGWAAFATALVILLGLQKLSPDRRATRTDGG